MKRPFRLPFSQSRLQKDVDAELSFHLEGRIEELVAAGMSRTEAEAEAARKFGDRARVEAEVERIDTSTQARISRRERITAFIMDLRFAARALARNPLHTAAVVGTLALAIGANTAIYTVAETVLLKPYDVPGIRRLAVVLDDFPLMGLRNTGVSPAEAVDLFERKDLFEATSATSGEALITEINGAPTRVTGTRTFGDFFAMFPPSPILGRAFRAEDSQAGRPAVVLLSHRLWVQLGSDSAIVGRSIVMSDRPYEVIGVAGPTFGFPRNAQYWRPFALEPNWLGENQRGTLIAGFLGRLRDGVSFETATTELRALAERFHKDHPSGYGEGGHTMLAVPFIDREAGQLKPIVLALFGAVVFVLLIACANVASLQLVRAAGRSREFALRAALGAGRAAIARHAIAETLLLAAAGAALGVGLGWLALKWLTSLQIAQFPALRTLHLNGTVLLVTASAVVFAAIAIGAAPAFRAMGVNVNDALRDSTRGASGGIQRHRFLRSTIIAQQALAMLLLVGAALTLRSLDKLLAVEPGFQAEQLATFTVSLPAKAYPDGPARVAFFNRLDERLRAVPGVVRTGFALGVPFSGSAGSTHYELPGVAERAGEPKRHANQAFVYGDYFATMGITIVKGRPLGADDYSAKTGGMVVDETLVKQSFGDADPIGAPIKHSQDGTIVGVARSVKLGTLTEEDHPLIYHNFTQASGYISTLTAVVRTTIPTADALSAAKRVLAELDPQLVFGTPRALTERVSDTLGPRRLATNVLIGFAVLALFIAVVGVYAVISYIVGQRTREIGIRVALGARQSEIAGMIVRDGVTMSVIGLVAGGVAIAAASRGVGALLYGVGALDPVSVGVSAMLLIAVTSVACWWPARRALRVNPVEVMRGE